jgi:acyl-CoA reductase-like NAD-dependent aldehyde dehydrogenase
VNNIVIDSTDAYKAMLGNLAFTLSLYSGQMCTTSQAIFVPAGGIDTEDGHKSYDEFCADLARPSSASCQARGGPRRARRDPVRRHRRAHRVANSGALGKVVLASTKLDNPDFPAAKCAPRCCWPATPPTKAYMEERFGPISFIVKVADTPPPSPSPSAW